MDLDLRTLERRASTGDERAAEELDRLRVRRGDRAVLLGVLARHLETLRFRAALAERLEEKRRDRIRARSEYFYDRIYLPSSQTFAPLPMFFPERNYLPSDYQVPDARYQARAQNDQLGLPGS